MLFREFSWSDNEWYSLWFADPGINAALGPAWVEAERAEVLDYSDGPVLVVQDNELHVAVLDIVLPTVRHNEVCIRALAVNPALQGQGWGRRVVAALHEHYAGLQGDRWIAYVEKVNVPAQRFFTALGWQHHAGDEMLAFTLRADR